MKTLLSLIIAISFSTSQLLSQLDIQISPSTIEPYVTYFSISDSQFDEVGLEKFEQIAEASHFLLLGERHYSARVSELSAAMLPLLAQKDFGHFALEVGPVSAQILTELSAVPENTVSNLKAFNSNYYDEAADDCSIPFFDGVEDGEFLQVARKHGYTLWGIDQEYYSATRHLIDRMYAQRINTSDDSTLYLKASQEVKRLYKKDASENRFRLFDSLSSNTIINEAIETWSKDLPANNEIRESLLATWDIYGRYFRRGGNSHGTRISYMREQFLKQYQSVANGQEKVFVKIGGLHTSIGPQLGAYDIGDLCMQIAQRQGKKSTSFACTSRFYQEDGKTHDYWDQSRKNGSVFDFSMLGEMGRYALIDLKSIREMVANGSISLPSDATYHEIRNIIDNYDHLIVLPLDEEQVPNR